MINILHDLATSEIYQAIIHYLTGYAEYRLQSQQESGSVFPNIPTTRKLDPANSQVKYQLWSVSREIKQKFPLYHIGVRSGLIHAHCPVQAEKRERESEFHIRGSGWQVLEILNMFFRIQISSVRSHGEDPGTPS